VVLDRRLRLPLTARLCDGALGATCVYTAPALLGSPQAVALRGRGVALRGLGAGGAGDQAELRWLLADLHASGRHRVLCEGGATLAGALLRAGLVDRLDVILAPKLLGAGAPLLAGLGVESVAEALALADVRWRPLGADLHLRARPAGATAASAGA
jgi:diaminohydroxyphosphoribosylaminopyrimidine deaminase/5-amino-6-(5-phosphoribosylamino)uracil reductase